MDKVLLVEDDLLLREINSDVLQSEGYMVTVAVDGEEALSKIKSGGWDLILMDVVIPKLNGFDVIERAKNEVQLMAPVVFFTNSDDPKDRERVKVLGGSYVIKGNITPPELIAIVKKNILAKQ
jgi:CheY-like chemotaxis protein